MRREEEEARRREERLENQLKEERGKRERMERLKEKRRKKRKDKKKESKDQADEVALRSEKNDALDHINAKRDHNRVLERKVGQWSFRGTRQRGKDVDNFTGNALQDRRIKPSLSNPKSNYNNKKYTCKDDKWFKDQFIKIKQCPSL